MHLLYFYVCLSLISFNVSFSLNITPDAATSLYWNRDDNIVALIDHISRPSDAIVGIDSSSGHYAITYQASRNSSGGGFIVIVDNDMASFNRALEVSKERSVYDRLVAFLIPRDDNEVYSSALDQLFLPPHVVQCPAVVLTSDSDPTFLTLMHMTMRCRPIVLAERNMYKSTAEFAVAMEMLGYDCYWHISSISREAVSIYMVAVPAEKFAILEPLVSNGRLLAVERDRYFIDEYNITLVKWSKPIAAGEYVTVDICIHSEQAADECISSFFSNTTRISSPILHSGNMTSTSCQDSQRYQGTIHIDDITHSMDDSSLQHCTASVCSLSVNLPAAMSLPAAQFIFYARCQRWVSEFNTDLLGACLMMLSARFEYWKRDATFGSKSFFSSVVNASDDFFDPTMVWPFSADISTDICSDPIWCSHTKEFQQRLAHWQYPRNPSPDPFYSFPTCDKAKFLVYQPYSHVHGIGSMILQVATMFRLALCLGRILYLLPVDQPDTSSRWLHPGCRNSILECYFERITNCTLPYDEYTSEVMDAEQGNMMHLHPFRDKRILYTRHLPTKGPCSVCGERWNHNTQFFDGLFTGESGYIVTAKSDGSIDDTAMRYFDQSKKHISHMDTFMLPTKHPWVSQFVRYVLKPRYWFAQYMQHAVSQRLMLSGKRVDRIPKPFASVHVRFGEKQLETALQPIDKYMRMLRKKGGNIRNVFLSTETDSIIEYLTSDYNFYYLNYSRHEYIHTASKKLEAAEYPTEYMMSMANLYVAVEADAFIGSLTSGWCMVIHAMERTRGDGGYDYFSVDRGTAYSTCF